MQRYFIFLSYKGGAFHGWQRQPNGVSVQQVLEEALSVVLRQDIAVVGAGRTDAGVHAKCMVAHFDVENLRWQEDQLVKKLNSLLPHDVAVRQIRPVKPDAHARFSALARRYEYWTVEHKDPFMKEFAVRVPAVLDYDKMNQAAACLFSYIDFTSFSKLHTDVKTNNCQIYAAEWQQRGEYRCFVIEADRFLRNMVRAIVGTLWMVGKGSISVEQFCQIIEQKDRCAAGTSAPAEGLYLVDVRYPDDIWM
ncbi:MAG: tRNA pseudouridine(38-40) synthase TruA [Paludibacteraceae bacterium]|nr:tRNA pseudouridine(38-40) synthase TruA [Paludibacteraceae bacterium]MBO7234876.1 tRNA pseudouridine(38-40) synthase TruA [Paludibacteraceae bacterium]MBO7259668.1 tRNA pseudouridine(38-40) synthase TruA [Paludibacteraceae bacterium]